MKRPSQKTVLLVLAAVFAAVGLLDSVLVHLKEIAALTDVSAFGSCTINSLLDCGAVARSAYSHVFGVPVSLFGIMYYTAFLALVITMLSGFRPRPWQMWGVSLLATGSLAFSAWLLYISYYGIGALCPYCLVSDASSAIVCVAWLIYHKISR